MLLIPECFPFYIVNFYVISLILSDGNPQLLLNLVLLKYFRAERENVFVKLSATVKISGEMALTRA